MVCLIVLCVIRYYFSDTILAILQPKIVISISNSIIQYLLGIIAF